MKARAMVSVAVSFVMAAAVLAQGSGEAKGKAAAKAPSPVFKPAADLKWKELGPGAPGAMIAEVWGDHTKGAYGAFIKFPAGFTTPMHSHTNPAKLVIISGTFLQTPEGKSEVRLGPGSYLYQPGITYKHTTGCDKASECLFFAQGTGKFDIVPAEGEKK